MHRRITIKSKHVSDATGRRSTLISDQHSNLYAHFRLLAFDAPAFVSSQPAGHRADRAIAGSISPSSLRQRKQYKCICEGRAQELHDALLYARHIDRVPTLLITINWSCLASTAQLDLVVRLGKVRDRMKQFIRRKTGKALVWVEVWENPGGVREHVHLAVFVPPELHTAFKRDFHS